MSLLKAKNQLRCRDSYKAAFLFAIVIVALFWPFFFEGKVIAPTDMLLDYSPWKSLRPENYVVSNTLRSDVVDQILPAWKFFQDQVQQGIFPLWNPFMAQGQPFLPLVHFSLLFPPVTILLLLFPLSLAFSLLIVFKLFAMGFFTYLFLRTVKLQFWPSISGALVYMLCGFNMVWLMWPHTLVAAVAPLLFLVAENLFKKPTLRNAAHIALIVALMIFAGFPSVAGYFFYAVWLYFLARCITSPLRKNIRAFLRRIGLLALGFILGASLCAIQLLPTFEYFDFIDISYRSAQSMSALPLTHFIQIFLPNFYGNPAFHNWHGELNYNETTGYIGLLPLFFLLISFFAGLLKKQMKPLFFSLLALLCLAVVFNIGPFLYLLHFLPVFNNSSSTRLFVLFGFCGAIAASFGFEYTIAFIKKFMLQSRKFFLRENFFVLLFFFFILLDLFIFALPQNPPTDSSFFYPTTPAIEFLKQNQKPYERMIAFDYAFMIPGTQLYYGLNSVFSHTFYSSQHKALLEKFAKPFVTPTAAVPTLSTTQISEPTIRNFGVKYLLLNPSQMSWANALKTFGYHLSYSGNDMLIMQTGTRTASQKPNKTLVYEPNTILYQTNSDYPIFLVTHELYYPGWRAFIAEKEIPIYKTNQIFRGVFVPAGQHTIRFEYLPNSFWIGLCISAFALMLIGTCYWRKI